METNAILNANILDILFDGKNKAYGAYALRKTYDNRINTALGVTGLMVLIFAISLYLLPNVPKNSYTQTIIELPPMQPRAIEDRKIVPPAFHKETLVKAEQNPIPKIVKSLIITGPIGEIKELTDPYLDTKSVTGSSEDHLIPAAENKGNNPIEGPVKNDETEDIIFISVEKEALFKGDWGSFVKKEIEKNIDELTEAGVSGTCIVKFVVAKDGSVSNVEAITMRGTRLAEVSVNAIRKGPKWIPAQQNGTIVNAYRQQPITFKIND